MRTLATTRIEHLKLKNGDEIWRIQVLENGKWIYEPLDKYGIPLPFITQGEAKHFVDCLTDSGPREPVETTIIYPEQQK